MRLDADPFGVHQDVGHPAVRGGDDDHLAGRAVLGQGLLKLRRGQDGEQP